jgi:hypothetical protein
MQSIEAFTRLDIPEANDGVIPTAGDHQTIGAETDGMNAIGVTLQHTQTFSILGIP